MMSIILLFVSILLGSSYCVETDELLKSRVLQIGQLWSGVEEETPQYVEEKLQHLTMNPVSVDTGVLLHMCPPVARNQSASNLLLQFDITPVLASPSNLVGAELKVFVRGSTHSTPLQVFQVMQGRSVSNPDLHRLLAVQFLTSSSAHQWLAFTVTAAVQDWLEARRPNLGLLISGVAHVPEGSHGPLLVLSYRSSNTPGLEVSQPQRVETLESCARLPWLLNGTQWGLLGPATLDLGRCGGSCSDLSGSSEHAALRSVLSQPGLTAPCCVPRHFRPAELLYRERAGNFVLKTIYRLVVSSCACQ